MCPTKNIAKASLSRKCSRKVQFHKIEIVEFPITLGDNPAVSGGPPLSTEMYPQRIIKADIDAFERLRPKRRSQSKLRISRRSREYLLLKNGFNQDDINQCSVEAERIRTLRAITLNQIIAYSKQFIAMQNAV